MAFRALRHLAPSGIWRRLAFRAVWQFRRYWIERPPLESWRPAGIVPLTRPLRTAMPIYEYTCKTCEHQFETLVRSGDTPVCAACGSADLERLLSLPTVNSEESRARALGAARKRDAAQATDRAHEQAKYERSHND